MSSTGGDPPPENTLFDVLALRDLFHREVLGRLGPTDIALLRRVSRGCRAAVEAALDLPRGGKRGG